MAIERLSAAEQAASLAGKKLQVLFKSGVSGGKMKPDRTLVTAADRKADQMIQDFIKEHFPGDGVLSEEGSTLFPETEHAWVIDPLDGTVNFSQGLLYWGVSIAHLVDGIPQDGAVYFPMLDELYTASLGRGAALNGKPLSITEQQDLELFPVFAHCSRLHERYRIKTRYKKRSLGAAAYHICMIASSAAALVLESTPRIWDFAAGWLIVQEAGGVIQALEGDQPFPAQPGVDYAKRPYPILAGRTTAILNQAVENITIRNR